ncbi:hypothetical protein GCM10009730_48830 [Streptomyces albidochromogenes]
MVPVPGGTRDRPRGRYGVIDTARVVQVQWSGTGRAVQVRSSRPGRVVQVQWSGTGRAARSSADRVARVGRARARVDETGGRAGPPFAPALGDTARACHAGPPPGMAAAAR